MMLPRNALAALLLTLAAALAQAQSAPQLGRNYIRLDPPQAVSSGDRIEVIEFFYYGCPVCYELEPKLSRWFFNAPGSITLRRVPALSSDNWDNFAKLFYTLEAMGQVSRLHWPVYDNFHFDGVKLNEEQAMAAWVSRNGLDKQKFIDTYRSPDIQAKLGRARDMTQSYEIRGVPSIVVDGKFVTSARMTGGTSELMQMVDQLVDLARKERGK
ncbi:MAG: thiol:disulfide interchange protein DsbA/DsbL [Burkholderiales bacterium]|nr:thiol:disulfide interchange protein DsbA/DsbL [Burkholderiales bacterium]